MGLAQRGLNLTLEKEELRCELYSLLSQGVKQDGESNNNLMECDVLSYGGTVCERTGLYY